MKIGPKWEVNIPKFNGGQQTVQLTFRHVLEDKLELAYANAELPTIIEMVKRLEHFSGLSPEEHERKVNELDPRNSIHKAFLKAGFTYSLEDCAASLERERFLFDGSVEDMRKAIETAMHSLQARNMDAPIAKDALKQAGEQVKWPGWCECFLDVGPKGNYNVSGPHALDKNWIRCAAPGASERTGWKLHISASTAAA